MHDWVSARQVCALLVISRCFAHPGRVGHLLDVDRWRERGAVAGPWRASSGGVGCWEPGKGAVGKDSAGDGEIIPFFKKHVRYGKYVGIVGLKLIFLKNMPFDRELMVEHCESETNDCVVDSQWINSMNQCCYDEFGGPTKNLGCTRTLLQSNLAIVICKWNSYLDAPLSPRLIAGGSLVKHGDGWFLNFKLASGLVAFRKGRLEIGHHFPSADVSALFEWTRIASMLTEEPRTTGVIMVMIPISGVVIEFLLDYNTLLESSTTL